MVSGGHWQDLVDLDHRDLGQNIDNGAKLYHRINLAHLFVGDGNAACGPIRTARFQRVFVGLAVNENIAAR